MTGDSTDFACVEAALSASGDLIFDWDIRTDTIRWLGPAAQAFGIEGLGPIGTGDAFHGRIAPDDLPARLGKLARHFSTGDRFDCEYRIRTGTGSFCWVHERGLAQFAPNGEPLRMVGTLRVVTPRKQTEERLEYLANFDELTGHYNRSRLRAAIDHALSACGRYGRTGGYLAVDIDNLAMINDAWGIETGDAVIVGLGERLDRAVGATDVVGRIEGDGFGVLLDDSGPEALATAADRIMRAVREQPIPTPTGAVAVTVSLGGVVFPTAAQTAFDVMARAELALGRAKQQGRNHWVRYELTESQRDGLRHDMDRAQEVQRALAEDRLLFAYQPVVDGATGVTAFHECLLRMRQPDGALLEAGQFVPMVEQLGLMRQIDRRALEIAVGELAGDTQAVLALNISGMTASDPAWLRSLVALLKGKPELATRLIVEITETAAIQDLDESARFVAGVRDLGCRVALDDFGAGYSSFRHLKALTVDMVKIDGSFVGRIDDRPENQLFIRTLVDLAAGFGLATVAEGVETQAEADHLVRAGVTYLQGYHIARPTLERPTPAVVPAHRLLAGSGARRVRA